MDASMRCGSFSAAISPQAADIGKPCKWDFLVKLDDIRSKFRRVGKGALAPCPPFLLKILVGTLRFAHPKILRHCERSEAIHAATSKKGWIASSLRSSQ